MRIIAITPPYFYPGEAEQIAHALENRGFWRVHIRKPDASAAQLQALICRIPKRLRNGISIHSHFNIAAQLGIGGVHLNSRNPQPPNGWNGIVSRSIHSIEELAGVTENYAFLSPIFPSISKPGYQGNFGLASLQPFLTQKIFALGGVTPEVLPQIEEAGFGGAAMLGAAWRREIDQECFRLQFITHPTTKMDVTAGAMEALTGGCRWIQLRHKGAPPSTLAAEARYIASTCRKVGAMFIIDDHTKLVAPTGADGVHLGKNDMTVAEARAILGPQKIIGATANTFADIMDAARQGADYIGLGPFRFTSTKQKLSPVLGTEGYRRILMQCRNEGIRLPVVAIGGITDADIHSIIDAGADGIAMSSSILAAASPAEQTARTIRCIQQSLKNNQPKNIWIN